MSNRCPNPQGETPPKSVMAGARARAAGPYQRLLSREDAGAIQAHYRDARLREGRLRSLRGAAPRRDRCGRGARHVDRAEPDRKVGELSPVEHGVLMLAAFGALRMPEIPYRVVINRRSSWRRPTAAPTASTSRRADRRGARAAARALAAAGAGNNARPAARRIRTDRAILRSRPCPRGGARHRRRLRCSRRPGRTTSPRPPTCCWWAAISWPATIRPRSATNRLR